MSRYLSLACVILLVSSPATWGQNPAPLTPKQKERLKERDRYDKESRDLEKANKLPEAIAAAEKMLVIELEVRGEAHPDIVGSLQHLARLNEALENFAAAEKQRQEALLLQTKLHGAASWQVVDARQDLRYVEKLKALDGPARQDLKTAAKLIAQAGLSNQPGKYRTAAALAAKAHDICLRQLGEDWRETALTAQLAGHFWRMANEFNLALPYFEKALAIRARLLGENHPDTAISLSGLGRTYFQQGNYAKAKPYYEKALAMRKNVFGDDHVDTAEFMNNLGILLAQMGEYSAARLQLQRALDVYKKVLGDNNPQTAQAFNNFGTLLQTLGDYEGARANYEKALTIRLRTLGANHLDTAESFNNLASVFEHFGNFSSARKLYEQALAISKKVLGDNDPDTADSLSNLGGLLEKQGDFAAARQCFEQALQIRKRVFGDDHPATALSMNRFGALLETQGDYAAARPYYEKALAIRKKVFGDKHPATANSLQNLATLFVKQHDYATARANFEQALAIFNKTLGERHPYSVACLVNLADLVLQQGDSDKAKRLFEQALALYAASSGENHPEIAHVLNNLGVLLARQSDYVGARNRFEQAIKVRKALDDHSPETIVCNCNLGALLFRLEDYTGAKSLFLQALESSRKRLALTAEGQSERQQFRIASMVQIQLDNYLSLAAARKFPADEVYQVVLSWKGAITARQRLLRQALQDPENSVLAGKVQTVTARLAGTAFTVPDPKKRDDWLRQIEELTREKESLEHDLALKSKSFAMGLKEPSAINLSRVLPASVALVDFVQYRHYTPTEQGQWSLESRLLAFICRAGSGVQMVEIGPVEAIENAIVEWRQQTKYKMPKGGLELRRLLWQPLEKYLGDASTVLLSPEGPLTQLPFAALPGKAPGSFLVEERAVVVVPLARWLPRMLQDEKLTASNDVPSLLLLGDVDFTSADAVAKSDQKPMVGQRAGLFKDWANLPGTRGEIAVIRDSFEQHCANGKLKVLRGPTATGSAVRQWAPKHQILHIATHGFFAPAEVKSALAPAKRSGEVVGLFDTEGISGFNPGLLSGIVLAGANRTPEPGQDDGVLTALAVQELDLRQVDLVVLSACETGLGQVAGGEGILGLQRSFQIAGAKTVIASLWTVDDEATRKLMERFYENLWSKKLSKVEALRQAQIAMLRGELVRGAEVEREPGARLSPYYWAAFVVSGDWR